MRKKDIIILIIIGLIILIPIIINEINKNNLNDLKKETLNISQKLENKYSVLTEIKINNKEYKTKGQGNAFINGKGVNIFLSYKNYCAIKMSYSKTVSLVKEPCPKLKLIKGSVFPIVNKDGLVKKNNTYYFKGTVDNYIKYNNELWRILGFENNKIKIIKDESLKEMSKNNFSNYLNKEYYSTLDKVKISKGDYDISNIVINNSIKINKKEIEQKQIGILSLTDYMNTLNDECIIKNNNLICGKSFITKTMWLSNYNGDKSYYLYNDGNIYTDNSNQLKNIYPVIYLNENINIISGNGTKDIPYLIEGE